MNSKEMEQKIIQNYQKDEEMMILVFAQWCVNHDLDPFELYIRAYPNQRENAVKRTSGMKKFITRKRTTKMKRVTETK
ncbi:hypothetical protein RYX51_12250 [Priestia filamentosa]|nr:hypothetical protein RYX51_12250 [Priestia filamentosa]